MNSPNPLFPLLVQFKADRTHVCIILGDEWLENCTITDIIQSTEDHGRTLVVFERHGNLRFWVPLNRLTGICANKPKE